MLLTITHVCTALGASVVEVFATFFRFGLHIRLKTKRDYDVDTFVLEDRTQAVDSGEQNIQERAIAGESCNSWS